MASEQFSLCWDNFHKNMSNGMNDLLECEDLVDVTLAIEGKYLKAHKMVLSVCSPYFKELFKTNPCQHPIVFMKDVTYEAMSDLLQFMYQGEVQVSQENLSTFIKTAEALQIKGLTGDGNGSNDADTSETITSAEKSRQVDTYKPIIKSKKQAASPLSSTPVPQAKRTRLSVSSNESRERTASKVEISSNLSDFKMEPYEQQQQEQQMMVEDVTEEAFDDTTLDETGGDEIGGDDGDDYSMIESASGREEEPKASTSGDGVAEGQELKSLIQEGIVIHNGFNYHRNTVKKCGNRHFICSEYKKLACRARLVLSANKVQNDFVLTGEHNHPSNSDNVLRDMFVRELKLAVKLQPERQLREIFDIVASANPQGAKVCSFERMHPSMRRWRTFVLKGKGVESPFTRTAIPTPSHTKNRIKHKSICHKQDNNKPRYIINGFVFHVNITKGNPQMIYLRCLEYKRLGCHARAVLPYNGSMEDLKINKPHNHPPDYAAEEKIMFMRELKDLSKVYKNATSRVIYENLAPKYPNAAREIPFKLIRAKINRWKKQLGNCSMFMKE